MSVGANVAGCLVLGGWSLPGSGGICSSRDLGAFRVLALGAFVLGCLRDFVSVDLFPTTRLLEASGSAMRCGP